VQRINAAKITAKAETRTVRDGEIQPACVQACPPHALVFGDLEDRESEVARLADSPRATHLLQDLGTRPNVSYLPKLSQQI
jgi:Fe-S-cluster-containing dehydrogenase component